MPFRFDRPDNWLLALSALGGKSSVDDILQFKMKQQAMAEAAKPKPLTPQGKLAADLGFEAGTPSFQHNVQRQLNEAALAEREAKEKEEIAALPFNLQHQLRSNPDIEYGSPDFKEIEKAYYDQVLVDQFKEEQAAKHEAFVEKVESANTAITGQKKYQREISTLTNLDQFWSIVGDAKDDLQIQYAGALLERIISNLADTNAKAYAELVHTMNMQSWPNAIADFVLRITEGTLSGASETELIKLAKNVEAATVGSNIDTIISTLRSRKAPYDVYRAVMVGNEYEPRRTREQWQKFIEE